MFDTNLLILLMTLIYMMTKLDPNVCWCNNKVVVFVFPCLKLVSMEIHTSLPSMVSSTLSMVKGSSQ